VKRKLLFTLAAFILASAQPTLASAACVAIKGGTIIDSTGNTVTVGFDQWGYNYQAHMFNGLYANFSRPATPATEGDVNLIMKWSDDWLSNKDCNGDYKLDRGGESGANANISKGWLTNHEEGDYLGGDEQYHHYTYFVKIVYDEGAACQAASYGCIWGQYNIIEEVWNDPFNEHHGVSRESLVNPAGLGFYTN
jgi:hypothetical protein